MPKRTLVTHTRIFGIIGRRTINTFVYLIDLTVFIMQTRRSWESRGGLFNKAGRQAVVNQLIFTGIDALPTITILSLAIGVSVTAQLIFLVQVFGSEADVVHVLTQVVALELGSLITAIVVIGRSGSAIAVDLGNMSLHREIEGLEMLGIDLIDFFVSPRMIGTSIAQLALAIYFAVLAIISGVVSAALIESMSYMKYLRIIGQAFEPTDLMVFLIKNAMFGIIIGATACYHGLQVTVSPTEVPQQTQRAIVNSLVIIFVLDGLIALALL